MQPLGGTRGRMVGPDSRIDRADIKQLLGMAAVAEREAMMCRADRIHWHVDIDVEANLAYTRSRSETRVIDCFVSGARLGRLGKRLLGGRRV